LLCNKLNIVRQLFFILSILILSSCHWSTKNKQTETTLSSQQPLLQRLRSYEPTAYKGKVPDAFYTYEGQYDWWRFPLVYPYSIDCIDVTDYGAIANDSGKTKESFEAGGGILYLTDYFDKFIFDKNMLVGNRIRTPFDKDTSKLVEQYFIFSFSTRTSENIEGRQNLTKKLQQLHFNGDTGFITIDEYANKL